MSFGGFRVRIGKWPMSKVAGLFLQRLEVIIDFQRNGRSAKHRSFLFDKDFAFSTVGSIELLKIKNGIAVNLELTMSFIHCIFVRLNDLERYRKATKITDLITKNPQKEPRKKDTTNDELFCFTTRWFYLASYSNFP